jgi:integrase
MSSKIMFTNNRIEELVAPPGGRIEYQDAKVPNLKLRVGAPTKSGEVARSWCYYRWIDGKPQRITIGKWPVVSIEHARKRAEAIAGEVALGKNPVEEKKKDRIATATLQEIFDEYLKTKGDSLKPRTVAYYRDHFRLFAKWADRPMSSITRDEVAELHAERAKQSKAAANGSFRVLRFLFNLARDKAISSERIHTMDNPVEALTARGLWKRVERRTNIIDLPRTGDYFDALCEQRPSDVADYIIFLMLTGMRRTVASEIKWSQIDLKLGTVALSGLDTKNHETVKLPLASQLVAILAQRAGRVGVKRSDLVFPGQRDPKKPLKEPRKRMKKAQDATGIKVSPHDLRRTFTSMAELLGTTDTMKKILLTHSNSDVTRDYVVMSPEAIRPFLQPIADKLIANRTVVPFQKVAA